MEINIRIGPFRYDLTRRLWPVSVGLCRAMVCVHVDTLWKVEVIYKRLHFLSEKTPQGLCLVEQHLLNLRFLPYLLQALCPLTSSSEGCGYSINHSPVLSSSSACRHGALLRSAQLNRVLPSATFLSYCRQSSKTDQFLPSVLLSSCYFFCFDSAIRCSSARDANFSRLQAGGYDMLPPSYGKQWMFLLQRLLQKSEAKRLHKTMSWAAAGFVTAAVQTLGGSGSSLLSRPNKCHENRSVGRTFFYPKRCNLELLWFAIFCPYPSLFGCSGFKADKCFRRGGSIITLFPLLSLPLPPPGHWICFS